MGIHVIAPHSGEWDPVYVTPNLSCDSEMPLPFLAAVFPQLTHGAEWTVAAKKTPSRVSPWLQPLGVFFVGNIADVSLPSAPGHVCTVTSACWMAAKVQVSEPLPEAYAKDSGNAAWRAAAGQIRRIPCLNVSSCVSLGARSCDSFRKMSMQIVCEKKWGVFLHTRFLHRIPESFHLAPAALLTQRPGDTSESQQHDVLRKPVIF